MTCEVLRTIEALGEQLQPGAIVNVDAWRPRNVQALIANGRLRELVPAAPVEPPPVPDGMVWQLVPIDKSETDKKPGKTGKES